MAALLVHALHLCCHVVAEGCWGLLPPLPASHWGDSFLIYLSKSCLPRVSRLSLRLPDNQCIVVVAPSKSCQGHVWMAKVRISIEFMLPTSPFAEGPKSESIAVCGTVQIIVNVQCCTHTNTHTHARTHAHTHTVLTV